VGYFIVHTCGVMAISSKQCGDDFWCHEQRQGLYGQPACRSIGVGVEYLAGIISHASLDQGWNKGTKLLASMVAIFPRRHMQIQRGGGSDQATQVVISVSPR
jgi:hypothetical protein